MWHKLVMLGSQQYPIKVFTHNQDLKKNQTNQQTNITKKVAKNIPCVISLKIYLLCCVFVLFVFVWWPVCPVLQVSPNCSSQIASSMLSDVHLAHRMNVMAIGYMIYYKVKLLTWDFLNLEHICYASKTTRTFPVSDLIKEYLKLLNRLYDIT